MAGPDMSLLVTAAIDIASVALVVLAVASAWLVVQVVVMGAEIVIEAVCGVGGVGSSSASDSYSERYSGEGFTDSSGNWVRDDPLAGVDDDLRRSADK